MTGALLLGRLRALLRDTGRGAATDSRFYSDVTLLKALNNAQVEFVKMLALDEGRHDISLSRLVKKCPANGGTVGLTVPDDYFLPICGVTATGGYLAASEIKLGEPLLYVSTGRVYVAGSKIYGPSGVGDQLVYYALPPVILNSQTDLPTFSDAVYHTIKFIASHNALIQEDRDAFDRFAEVQKEIKRKVGTIK